MFSNLIHIMEYGVFIYFSCIDQAYSIGLGARASLLNSFIRPISNCH